MKCITAIFLMLSMILSIGPVFAEGNSYELWTESPYITSGLISDDLNIYRAKNLNELELYPLSRLGNNYYFAICEEKWTDGGYNGTSKTSILHCYLILVNGGDFIILSSKCLGQEYLWDRSVAISNLASTVTNTSWYSAKGSEIPYYVIQPQGLYTNSQYTKYLEQIIVTSGGKLYSFSNSADYGCESYPVAYNNLLFSRADRYRSGSSYYYYYVPEDSTKRAARMVPYLFTNGIVSYDETLTIQPALTTITAANGYTVYLDNFTSNVTVASSDVISPRSSTFPDGRRVEVYWVSMGNYLYEVWYRCYNPDGTLRANGPTGYTAAFSSSFNTYSLMAIAINNSKFMICVNKVGHSFMKEYFRVALVEETITGEIQTGGRIGTKNIVTPSNADTTPVESSIDFAQDNLPLGFTIKDNAVTEKKLDTPLKQQINAVRLNDIVILKKSGYASGTQNTGIPLTYFSLYDYGLGSTYIRFYTNGSNFLWYCYYPESLTPGTYNKSFTAGDKTIYVTVKVVEPPDSSGVTTVVF